MKDVNQHSPTKAALKQGESKVSVRLVYKTVNFELDWLNSHVLSIGDLQ